MIFGKTERERGISKSFIIFRRYQNHFLILLTVVFENTLTLAVATTSRRLIFFNLDTLALLPIEISASPSPKTIHKMTLNDARNALKILESPQMPMFNSPSTMAIMSSGSPVIATTVPPPINSMTTPTVSSATASISKGSLLTHKSITNKKPKKEAETKKSDGFFVGDDQGIIEAFKLVAPLRRQGTDFTIDRVGRCQVHNGLISQIIPIDSFETYASASHDNTIKLWKYDIYTKSFTIVRVFQDDQPVLSIIFSSHQKVIASCSSARDAFVWSLSPPRKIFKLGSHYNQLQLITDYITTTNERYILTMTNKKEFRLWDSVNYRMVREWSDPSCPEWKYTAAFFDERRHVLIAAHRDIIKWAEDESALLESKEAHTHRRPIVGCFLSNAFGQIVTIDSVCSIRVWNVETGTMASSHNEPRAYGNSDICTATLDCSGRRLLTSDFKNNVLMRNYNSGSELATLNLPHTSSLITILNSCTIGGRDYLIRAGWDKTIALFCEAEQYHYELHRMFSGHSTDISAVAGFNIGVISGTINGEIFSWTFDSHIPIAAKELVSHATVEFLIIINDKYLVVGDSACTMSLFSLPKLLPITSFEFSHGIYSPCSLSAAVCERVESSNKSDMCYILYTADTLGYVQTWKIMIGSLDNDIKISKLNDISRLSNDEINKLIVYNDFFIVCCVDSCVRVFTKEDFAYIGFFSDESSWSLDDESTWVYTCIDIDKKHFKEPLNGERSHVMAARSLRIMPQFSERFFHESFKKMDDTLPNLFGDSYLENTCNQGISPSFSFEEFGKTMDEYIQGGRISQVPSRINIDDVINEKAKSKREPKLKLSMRPADLINNIDCLLSKIPTPTLTPNPEFSRINFNLPVMNYTKKEVIRPTTTSSFAKIPIHMKMNNYIYHDSKKRRRKNAKKPTPLFLLT